jgi:uncharacterized secreted protein with C-terminal beta-propeller domain
MSDFEERARRAADGVRRAIDEQQVDIDKGSKRAKRTPGARAAIPGTVAVVALITGLFVALPNDDDGVQLDGGKGTFALAGELKPFAECDAALEYFKKNAPEYFITRAGGGGIAVDNGFAATAEDAPVTTMTAPGQQSFAESPPTERNAAGTESTVDASSPSFSTTNVAEKGVDEPDIVKTDGRRIVAVTSGKVRLLDANDGNPIVRATLPFSDTKNVFIKGNRLVVFRSEAQYRTFDAFGAVLPSKSTISVYDIADISAPRVISNMEMNSGIIDARLVGDMVRVVTSHSPDVDIDSPEYDPNGQLSEKSKQSLRDEINKSSIDTWLPTYTLRDASNAVMSQGKLVDCAQLGHPKDFSGIDTVTLTAFDVNGNLNDRKAAGVVAGGQMVYATTDNLYVTSSKWTRNGWNPDTDVHEFTTDSSGSSSYKGSGQVPGTLVNQYSMSEHNGVLRIATTTSGRRGWVNQRSITEGMVNVLQLKDGRLQQIGRVDGLGREDNESIKSVRFVGDRGYVTTFRQTDPLYVIDLKEAAAPKVVGELKIPGYSGYLHPIGDTLVLGVGQSGTEQPSVREPFVPQTTIAPPDGASSIAPAPLPEPGIPPSSASGVEFSLFDVSDPATPRKIGSQVLGNGQAGAEFDPKAFLYWEPRNLIIAPVNLYGTFDHKIRGGQSDAWSGLVMLRATKDGLTEVGRLQNTDAFNVQRSFVIDNDVFQLADTALQVNDLDTHKLVSRVPFGN